MVKVKQTGSFFGITTAFGITAAVLLLSIALPQTGFAQSRQTTTQQTAGQRTTTQQANGQLTEQSLGNLLGAMGLRPAKKQKRYDFRFKATLKKEDWELSMSAVLSQNGESLWVIAWLDELPKSAADVPRTALLRLLAANDSLGKGKAFAYIPSNRRFVLQRVLSNKNMTTATLRDALKDLGSTVVLTYPQWSTSNWKSGGKGKVIANSQSPIRTTHRDPKFKSPIRNPR